MVVKVNTETFQAEVLTADKLVMVDLYADWCGPCKMMAPVIDRLALKNQEIKFCKVNVDESMEIAQKYRVAAVPTFLLFKNGEMVDQMVGGPGMEDFQELLDKWK